MWSLIVDALKKGINDWLEKVRPIKHGWVDWRKEMLTTRVDEIATSAFTAERKVDNLTYTHDRRLKVLEAAINTTEGGEEWRKHYAKIDEWTTGFDQDMKAMRSEVAQLNRKIDTYGPPNMDVKSVRIDLMGHIEKLEAAAGDDRFKAVNERIDNMLAISEKVSAAERLVLLEKRESDLRNQLDARFEKIDKRLARVEDRTPVTPTLVEHAEFLDKHTVRLDALEKALRLLEEEKR